MPFSPLDPKLAVRTRDLALYEYIDKSGRSLGVKIEGKDYNAPVTEIVKHGSVEKWRFINTTADAHSMHLHMVPFQVMERQGFDTRAFSQGILRLAGPPRTSENERGWKDTAHVNPSEVLTILVRFDSFPGRSAYHCHMLEHEDNDMMRPYEVVP
jgi:spore coat protein A